MFWAVVSACLLGVLSGCAAIRPDSSVTFEGTKQDWRGYDRYAFWVKDGFCWVTAPKTLRPGRPWVWRLRYPQVSTDTDKRLLDKGYHVVWMSLPYLLGAPAEMKSMDAFYETLTGKYGLSRKPVLRAVSRGNLSAHNWAVEHPGQASCIVGVVPVCDFRSWPGGKGVGPGDPGSWQTFLKAYGLTEKQAASFSGSPIDRLKPLAEAGVPILHLCNPDDEIVPYAENTKVFAERYRALGGPMKVVIVPAAELPEWKATPKEKEKGDKPAHGIPGTHLAVGRAGLPDAEVEFILRHTAAR